MSISPINGFTTYIQQPQKLASQNLETNPTQKATPKYKIRWGSTTGYMALAAGIVSVATAKAKKFKCHKPISYIAGALTIIHVALIEWKHRSK